MVFAEYLIYLLLIASVGTSTKLRFVKRSAIYYTTPTIGS